MGLEQVIHEKCRIDHEDKRRTLTTAFNGDIDYFKALQVKFLDVKENDVALGGHYHRYSELFYLRRGKARIILEDVKTAERRVVDMEPMDRIFIPPEVAHVVLIKANSVLVGMTEFPYVSAEENDILYEVKH